MESKGNNITCDFLEIDKCVRGRLVLVCDNKNNHILEIDSYESINQISVAKMEKCEWLSILEPGLMVLYVPTSFAIFKMNLQDNNFTK